MNPAWYIIKNMEEIDTPSLAVYPERVKENIRIFVNSVPDVSKLRPHIKTHKSSEVSTMMLDAGITKFKCATIAEAEMLGSVNAPDVLLAYQPVGPKAKRFAEIVKQFPETKWACLIDNIDTAKEISDAFQKTNRVIYVFIDLNVGMNRTGIVPEKALELYNEAIKLKGINVVGLHAYDGHLRDTDFSVRTKRCDEGFQRIKILQEQIFNSSGKKLNIVVGGTPTFSIHSKRKEAECSPGTFIYWDKGYADILKEQNYNHAALVITRVISKPAENTICVDLGHKAIAAENPIANRVFFLNAPELEPIGHSEEHMVFKTQDKDYNVGDVLYGIPFHICPTVALHDVVHSVTHSVANEKWNTAARKRKITI